MSPYTPNINEPITRVTIVLNRMEFWKMEDTLRWCPDAYCTPMSGVDPNESPKAAANPMKNVAPPKETAASSALPNCPTMMVSSNCTVP